jgi:hypothetical protein
MTPIGHFAAGFAARRMDKKVPLGVLLAASWLLDLLYFVFAFAGLESLGDISKPGTVSAPWSHGLFMSLLWSVGAGLLAGQIYHSQRTGVVIGLVVFSHWILDFISWNNLLLLFNGSPQVGLGLFSSLGSGFLFVELGLFLAGLVVYLTGRRRSTLAGSIE